MIWASSITLNANQTWNVNSGEVAASRFFRSHK